ncbi:MAG TPA: hypothetical protein VGN54_03130 [Mycobacteriales bacterium]|jgi:hypothetical protein|nr:hypothetical protein [Mycobacteriales bacterium]
MSNLSTSAPTQRGLIDRLAIMVRPTWGARANAADAVRWQALLAAQRRAAAQAMARAQAAAERRSG